MSPSSRQNAARSKKAALYGREHAKNRRVAKYMIAFLAIVCAFVVGFLLRSNIPLMASLGIPVDEVPNTSTTTVSTSKLKAPYETLSTRISEVEDMLSSYSFDEVQLDEATNLMLEDLMKSTQDPYAVYFSPERYETYMLENADKSFSGVGVLFGDYQGRAYAIDVLEGSEAQAEGVQQGDFVKAIDGNSSHEWSASEVIGAISREDGESVVITWMRPMSLDAKTGETFTTTLVCRDYDVENVTSQLYENVGYIKLRQITGNSADLVEKAVADLAEQGALACVLDITDNPGGYLTQSLDIASLFVQSGVLVSIKTLDGLSTRNASGTTETTLPLVVMTNNFTSGVSEVLAAALKDNQRATIVGQKTAGKGSVQVTRELPFGGGIRYTAAYYLTPDGQEINGVGISPNIEVVNSPDSEDNIQLQVAIETARSQIGT